MKNQWFESNLSKITRPVAAIKSLRFALFTKPYQTLLMILQDVWSVWYKTKIGSQSLATNFGVFFMIYVMFPKKMFNVTLIMMWQIIVVVGFPTTEIWPLENLEGYQLW